MTVVMRCGFAEGRNELLVTLPADIDLEEHQGGRLMQIRCMRCDRLFTPSSPDESPV